MCLPFDDTRMIRRIEIKRVYSFGALEFACRDVEEKDVAGGGLFEENGENEGERGSFAGMTVAAETASRLEENKN